MSEKAPTKKELLREMAVLRQKLETAESQYSAIINNLADGYYEVDLNGNLTFFNNSLATIFGYPREELLGMNNREYTDQENALKMYQAFNLVYRTGTPIRGVRFETITKQKNQRQLELSISLRRDEEGRPVGFQGIARDITDLIDFQKSLKAGEERYRNIIETINDPYYEVDLEGNLTFFNDAFLRGFNTTKEELLGINYREYTDQENADILFEAFNRVFQTGDSLSGIRHEVITPNTHWRGIFEASVSMIKDTSGNPVGFRGISRDMTDLIRIQNDLKASEERYRNIIETIEDGYYEVDLKGDLTYFNDAYSRIMGYSREELTGMNNRQRTDPENARIAFQAFNRIFHTAEPAQNIQYEILAGNGERKTIATSASLIREADGNPVGFRGIMRDISEIRRAEKSLKLSEERFRIAAESASDFLYEWDLQSGEIRWFSSAEEKLLQIFGEIPVQASAFERHIHPEDLEHINQAIRRHVRDREPYLEGYRLIGKEGRIFHIRAAGKVLRDEKGWAYKWIGAISDITEQKKSEEQLRQSIYKLHKSMGGIIQAMALTVESKDPYTAGHQQRVSSLARILAQEIGLSTDQVEAVRLAGVVHDLGKISVPAEILSKPTELTPLEFGLIKAHPQTSYDILKDIDFPWPVARIVLQHHERLDGSGYPFGLKKKDVLIEAQVLMVADVVEAIASHRPYRPAHGVEAALEEIEKNKGSLYNTVVVEACLRLFREKGFFFGEPFQYHPPE
ncbi:MAG: PAS domain S-box protein [Thermodesulfobacteriota bacterium]